MSEGNPFVTPDNPLGEYGRRGGGWVPSGAPLATKAPRLWALIAWLAVSG